MILLQIPILPKPYWESAATKVSFVILLQYDLLQ